MPPLKTIYNKAAEARRLVIWTLALEAMRKNQPGNVLAAIKKIGKVRTSRDRLAADKLLRWSVNFGHLDVAGALLERGVDPDIPRALSDGTVLFDTITTNNAPMAALLLKHGASPDTVSEWGHSVLHMAVSYNRPEIIKLLLAHDVDVTLRNKQGLTALELARKTPVPMSRRVLEEYLSFGHARQVKNIYKSKRKPARPAPRRRAG